MAPRLSPSQKQLLSLYRRGLRGIRRKPEPSQPSFHLYLRQLFRAPFGQAQPIARRDFGTLDYLSRTLHRTMASYFDEPSVRSVHLPQPLPLPIDRMGSARLLRTGFRVEGGQAIGRKEEDTAGGAHSADR